MSQPRGGFTLTELIVVLSIIGVLIGLFLPALMRTRDAAGRTQCLAQLHQIGLAVHLYHDGKKTLPSGMRFNQGKDEMLFSSWLLAILPYIDREADWREAVALYRAQPHPFKPGAHHLLGRPIPLYICPADPWMGEVMTAQRDQFQVAMTSYLGVLGRNLESNDGVLFRDSRVRLTDIHDGCSQTLLAGERPGSADGQFGWWYAGAGQRFTGSGDMILGVEELNKMPVLAGSCPPGRYQFEPGSANNQCDMFHFWSMHSGGANWLFCDGGARFMTYDVRHIMGALATRSGGDNPGPDF